MTADRDANESLLASGACIVRVQGWVSAEVGDEMVLMNVASGRYIGFSETGKRIWELLPLTLSALCDALAEEYDAAVGDITADTITFVHDMLRHDAVALDPAP